MQSTARKNELPLDKMSLACEVTKKTKEEMQAPPREGAYIHGLFMEGARWDVNSGLFTFTAVCLHLVNYLFILSQLFAYIKSTICLHLMNYSFIVDFLV